MSVSSRTLKLGCWGAEGRSGSMQVAIEAMGLDEVSAQRDFRN